MKKLILSSVTCVGLFIGMSQCDTSNPQPIDLTVNQDFVGRTTEFAFDFVKELEKEEAGKNFFVSPLSLHMALGMLLNGSDGSSKEELLNTLNLKGLDDQLINTSYSELIDKLPKADPKVTNTLANSIWQREGFNVEKSFLDIMKETFNAELYQEPFNDATLKKINQWASDNTNAKIDEILTEISADQVMFIINALYFKGDWALQFDKEKTQKVDFAGLSGTQKVDMMSALDTFSYADMTKYQVLEMDYGSGNYAMRVMLPNEEVSVVELINTLDKDEWDQMSKAMRVGKVDLRFPKVKLEYNKKLNNVLAAMGMPSLFSSSADLSKISPPAGRLVVGFVKQDAFIEIDEEGTEAAAVTTIGIELTSAPMYPVFNCNRPFVFTIYEKSSGTVQFVGKILNL